jgi:hypothetical protein
MFTIPVECDDSGNIYFHVYQAAYVTKVSADGKVGKQFSLEAVPDSDLKQARKASIVSYAADQRGNVYEVVR